jgi:hypothetical protein
MNDYKNLKCFCIYLLLNVVLLEFEVHFFQLNQYKHKLSSKKA